MKEPAFNTNSLPAKTDVKFDGWANSATAIFYLYLSNNREWMDKAFELSENWYELSKYIREIPVELDNWCEGQVFLEQVRYQVVRDKAETSGTAVPKNPAN